MRVHLLLLYSVVVFFLFNTSTEAQENYILDLVTAEEHTNFGDVHNLYEDSSGIIWMGIYGKGLAYYNGKNIVRYELEDEDKFSSRNDVFVTDSNFIYLNDGEGVRVFDPIVQNDPFTIKIPNDYLQRGELKSIAVTQSNGKSLIWGTFQLNKSGEEVKYTLMISRDGLPFEVLSNTTFTTLENPVIKAYEDYILTKTKNEFLYVNDNGVIEERYPLPDIPTGAITTFNWYIDHDNSIYVGGKCSEALGKNKSDILCDLWKKERESKSFVKLDLPGRFYLSNFTYKKYKGEDYVRCNAIDNGKAYELYTGFSDTSSQSETIDYLLDIKSLTDGTIERFNVRAQRAHFPVIGTLFTINKSKSGVIWMGTNSGLAKLVPQPEAFKMLEPIGMRNFIEDEDGNIYGGISWFDETGGYRLLNRYDPKTGNVSQISNKDEYHIHYHADYYKERIYTNNLSFNIQTRDVTYYPDITKDFGEYPILSLLDRKGKLWKAHWSLPDIGLYDPNTGKRIRKITVPALLSRPVELNDWYQRPSDGTIWLGTQGQGIFVFSEDGDLLHHFNRANTSIVPLNNTAVAGFYEDKEGNMWIGHGSGISSISPNYKTIDHYTFDQNQPESRMVYSLLPEDDDRFLWMSTSRGVFRFDKKTKIFQDFPLHSQMMNFEFNRASFLKTSNGQFYFGTASNSLPTVSFLPRDVISFYNNVESQQSNIILTSFSKFDPNTKKEINIYKGLQAIDEIIIKPDERYFSLSYFVGDYRSPENNYYSFYLENYDEDWNVIARENNIVRYENLPPGDYVLKLSGALLPNNVISNQRSIKVTVLPYWYQTLWAKIGGALAILGLGFFIYRFNLKRQFEKQETKRLKEVDNLKTRLYTNITHEFRTPLTVIMGMNDTIKGFDKERNLIKRNAKNLLSLINQLLDLSKFDSGTMKMDTVKGDVILYLKYLTESFYSMASDKKVNLSFHSDMKSLIINYDEIKLQHVIYNLLSNAIKFTRPGGKVNLTLKTISYNNRPHIEITVKDTGIGIDPNDLAHIFERFYQAYSLNETQYTTKTFGGTGIGLALTKELVELMKGTINVQSEKSWGSRFTVCLPIENNNFEQEENSIKATIFSENEFQTAIEEINNPTDHTRSDKPLLLLIEDNSGVVAYIRAILDANYEINVAINGQEGIEMAIERIPDIIITDVMMPEKNGYEVCGFLKNDDRTNHIPIIILTAKADISSKLEGLETGADVYLSKPFEKEELLIQLKNLLTTREKLQTYYTGTSETVSEPFVKSENAFIEKLRSYVDDHIQDSDLSVSSLSGFMGLSHVQLYRKLKALTGQTPSQFIRSIRLKKALVFLETTDLNISEIAYEVGFNDPNYFTRVFKQEFGKVPGEVRGR